MWLLVVVTVVLYLPLAVIFGMVKERNKTPRRRRRKWR